MDRSPRNGARAPETQSSAATLPLVAAGRPETISSAQTILADSGGTLKQAAPGERLSGISVWGPGSSEPGAIDMEPAKISGQRYVSRRILGQGGMGEVHLSADAWLGRDVAMKVMRSGPGSGSGSDGRGRFLREARLQGQLEHPSIVPVYDLGLSEDGAPYFTMKRVQGLTLREVIDRTLERDEGVLTTFPRRKVLGALAQACLGIAFGHARGAVHRDIKPENLMLGEFGEVYVLDWGVAKVKGVDDPVSTVAGATLASGSTPPADDVTATAAGSLVGTPGYMSPEQAQGDQDAISPRSDVYAMGAVLFEVLCLEPLHKGRTISDVLVSTLRAGGARPSTRERGADVPPELDDLCARATALDPAERPEDMRALGDELQAYLDGERDVERRRALAAEHVDRAKSALDAATRGGAGAEELRADGLRELGRALALEPSDKAIALLGGAILSSSSEIPAEAQAELSEVELKDRATSVRRAGVIYGALVLFVPLLMWLGVNSWPAALAVDVTTCAMAAHAFWMAKTGNVHPRHMRVQIFLNFMFVAFLSGFMGPFFIVPGIAAATSASFIVGIRANRWTQRLLAGLSVAAIVLPALLEWTGFVPPSYAFDGHVISVLPRITNFPPLASQVFMLVSAVTTVLMPILLVGRSTDSVVAAERRNFMQAYRLRQLLPAGATELPAPRSAEGCII